MPPEGIPLVTLKKSFREAGRAILLLSFSLVISVLLVEVVIRIIGNQSDVFHMLDPDVGTVHIPIKSGWYTFEHGRIPIDINSAGYRDVQRDLKKNQGTYRIAVLGDSFVAGFQVRQEDLLTSVLEERLNDHSCSGTRFEVLNFGVNGAGTAQELETLRHKALAFEPDLVLLFFYPSNDLFDNSQELRVQPFKLYYEFGPNGGLQKVPYTVVDPIPKQWLRQHSKAYLFFHRSLAHVTALRRALRVLNLVQPAAGVPTERSSDALEILQSSQYLREPPPAIDRAWRLTEALIKAARSESAAASADFAIIVIPNQEEILGNCSSAPTAEYDFESSLSSVHEICERHGIPLLSLVDDFRSDGKSLEEYYYPQDGHWTAEGHRLAALVTVEWLRPTLFADCSDQQSLPKRKLESRLAGSGS